METKLARLLGHLARGEDIDALRMAARFPRLGEHKDRITRAWAAHTNPDTYSAMGYDVAAIVADGIAADFVFTCPPYADLERYSDDPRDLSAMDYPAFVDAYRAIIDAACARLRDDRFAAIVVGDVRDKAGFYRGLPELTVAVFADAGLKKYNEAILATSVGSLPVRIASQFNASRKMGKTHQNFYVFVKGDPKKATAAIGNPDAPTQSTLFDVA